MDITAILAREFETGSAIVARIVSLIDEGNTIPFIARYRKEQTGAMDDQKLRELSERLEYLRAMDRRREQIRAAVEEQGKLDDALSAKLLAASTLSELEDLYRPYKPKRRTRAMIAREKGVEPLADALIAQRRGDDPLALAAAYVSEEKGVPDAQTALQLAQDILAERISDDAAIRASLRALVRRTGVLRSVAAKEGENVYQQYADYREPVLRAAGHRILAINRGEREEWLRVSVEVDEEQVNQIICRAVIRPGSACCEVVRAAARDAWGRLIAPSLEREIRNELTDRANEGAIRVFGQNLRQLLMQPPVRGKVTLGVDPGFRTGCKLAVVDANGRVLETGVGYFTLPGQEQQKARAKALILSMIRRYGVTAIAIGNGTASRESEQFIVSLLPEAPGVAYTIVSEAGASVYSASKLAAKEFPDYDVSLRSAVSIARRLQDPLAELVKIDPKAIGVGQYQHDLKQAELESALAGVVESCVSSVGVDVETASASLLTHVAGIGETLAGNIIAYREENGITSRAQLKKVPKLGPKAFEQCAGFLRVHGSNPLDATAVHPESYPVARALLEHMGVDAKALSRGGIEGIMARAEQEGIGKLCAALNVGEMTLRDILSELEKPGRDPREALPAPVLRTDVLDISDLTPGMELTGTVRNVIDFGAFVDIGVHQDGLVHISRMADRYIRHPSEVVSVGDVVKVYVVDVDVKKKRIALSMVKGRT
ncbi:MAG TPA: RNA-binding transcriptional accessory protein [Candidatus Ventricola gallistercoris]|nr:RNA-binding transcriptional accessory protein [Candidatus Ventricola gallistercoris]